MHVLRGILGIAVILGLAWLLSRNRRAIRLRVVAWGLVLQIALGLLIFETEVGAGFFRALAAYVSRFLEFSYVGSAFVFGSLGAKPEGSTGITLAFQALPIVIYFSAVMAVLYHFGIMQAIVYLFSRFLGFFLRTSGAESMAVAANIFVGMTEAPLVVRPYIATMTRSELMALMTGGFATIAGTVLGVYMLFVGQRYGAFLIAASVMAAPAAFVTAKMIVPESEETETGRRYRFRVERQGANLLDAISLGVRDGLALALNIAAMLVAFYGLVALANWPLGEFGLSVERILGWVLSPFAWCIGVDWRDAESFGSLLGTKIVINEWIGYQSLSDMIRGEIMSPRSITLATFALCGFANLGSIGITLGGLGQLAPSRRGDLARDAFLAMIAGALASCLTAAVAGMFIA